MINIQNTFQNESIIVDPQLKPTEVITKHVTISKSWINMILVSPWYDIYRDLKNLK